MRIAAAAARTQEAHVAPVDLADARTGGSARRRAAPFRWSASSLIDGSGTRAWTRRCSCSSSICRSTAEAEVGLFLFQAPELGDFPGFGARLLSFGHAGIVSDDASGDRAHIPAIDERPRYTARFRADSERARIDGQETFNTRRTPHRTPPGSDSRQATRTVARARLAKAPAKASRTPGKTAGKDRIRHASTRPGSPRPHARLAAKSDRARGGDASQSRPPEPGGQRRQRRRPPRHPHRQPRHRNPRRHGPRRSAPRAGEPCPRAASGTADALDVVMVAPRCIRSRRPAVSRKCSARCSGTDAARPPVTVSSRGIAVSRSAPNIGTRQSDAAPRRTRCRSEATIDMGDRQFSGELLQHAARRASVGGLRRRAGALRSRRPLRRRDGDYPDNAWRFAVFSRAALEYARAARRAAVGHPRARLADRPRAGLPEDAVLARSGRRRRAGRLHDPQPGVPGAVSGRRRCRTIGLPGRCWTSRRWSSGATSAT